MLKTTRQIDIAMLLGALFLAGGAAFGLGALWTKSRVSNALNLPLELLLGALFAGAATLVVRLQMRHQRQHQMQRAAQNRRFEAKLRAAESRFEAIYEQFPFSIQVVGADGITRSVNRAWEDLFGARLDHIQDINLISDPALRASGSAAHIEAALRGQASVAPAELFDMRECWPFSSHPPGTSRWIKATMCPVKTAGAIAGGAVTELLIIHEDVTEQKVAREARHQSETRKAAIVEAALDCIISMDDEGRVIEWNPSAETTFGFAHHEAVGHLLADLIIPVALRERHALGLKRYLETGEGPFVDRKIEVMALRADGSKFPVELAITSMMSGQKRIFSAFLRDLTSAKAAEAALLKIHNELENRVTLRTSELSQALEQLQANYEQLERLEDLRDTLTGMVVHDLRTPLSSMLFGLQTVTFLGTVNAAQQECLDIFKLGCRDSLGVINDLLDIGKMESSAFSLQKQPSDAGGMVIQALKSVAMLAAVKKLQLDAHIEHDLPQFPADGEKLGRVLMNLLGNAIKFVPHGGVVTLGAQLSPDAHAIHFWVRDNGAGVPAEAFERIFEKFGQVENGLGGGQTSSGLGLAFCKMIVEAHGGRIWVESQTGQGSLFTATFPFGDA